VGIRTGGAIRVGGAGHAVPGVGVADEIDRLLGVDRSGESRDAVGILSALRNARPSDRPVAHAVLPVVNGEGGARLADAAARALAAGRAGAMAAGIAVDSDAARRVRGASVVAVALALREPLAGGAAVLAGVVGAAHERPGAVGRRLAGAADASHAAG